MSDADRDLPLRVGFIGCGRHATKMLYPSIHLARMELMAVCDMDERAAQRNARWFGAKKVYTDSRRMLDEAEKDGSVEAVLICTGPKTHASLTLECLERGFPVFVEKPPAGNLMEAELLRERSDATNVPVMVGTMKRHATIYRRMKEIISTPEFGPIAMVSAKMGVGWKNCNGFALLLDAGIHVFDLLRFLMGEVADVTCRTCVRDGSHTAYVILLTFESGAVGTLTVTDQQSWTRHNERVEVTGAGEFVVADNMIHLSHYRRDGEIACWEPGYSIPSDENNSLFLAGYAGELQAFRHALRQGLPVHASIADACAALRIIKALEPDETYKKGPVEFPHWKSENYWLRLD